MSPFSLVTLRLRLRQMSMADLDFVSGMLADKEVMRYYPQVYSRMEAAEWIERQMRRYRDDGYGLWMAEDKTTFVPIGQVGLSKQNVDGVLFPEIGYLIHRLFWRQGFASEAAFGVREYAFDTLKQPKVISLIRPDNLPSRAVAEKIGMVAEGETMHHELLHIVYGSVRGNRSVPGERS